MGWHNINTRLIVGAVVVLLEVFATGESAQRSEDDFNCPDVHIGFYPHLYSCDKYWYCEEGRSELRTCGNGLGFIDTDPTYTLEQCAELHLVECGDRTELEPPISTPHCPRAWGTFADQDDCGVFWLCQNGKANRYQCPPGLAYDKESRGCRWADQVAECSNVVVVDDDGGEFQCPRSSSPGIFTKHAHPVDCRQYYLCIGGIPREYGCPLGTVFNIGSGNGVDGECSDPSLVPECQQYYDDIDLDPRELATSGFNKKNKYNDIDERPRSSNTKLSRNNIKRPSAASRDRQEQDPRPAPVELQDIVDRPSVGRTRQEQPSQPLREQNAFSDQPIRSQPSRLRPEPQLSFQPEQPIRDQVQEQEPVIPEQTNLPSNLPSRLTPIRIQSKPTTTTSPPQTQKPSRLEFLPSRPGFRSPFRQSPSSFRQPQTTSTTTQSAPASRLRPLSRGNAPGRLSFSSRFRPTPPPTTTTTTIRTTTTTEPLAARPQDGGLPPPIKAAPGPNGEEYYYYYYYDDEEV